MTGMGGPRSSIDVGREATLSAVETIALRYCVEAIAAGRRITQDGLCAAVGGSGGGTAPTILKRLEEKGYITRKIFQRGVQVCIKTTGQCSLPPPDTSPHWRLRTERTLAPAANTVRNEQIGSAIEADARARGVNIQTHLHDLVYIGHHAYRTEQDAIQPNSTAA